jgi:hypothetical protein
MNKVDKNSPVSSIIQTWFLSLCAVWKRFASSNYDVQNAR